MATKSETLSLRSPRRLQELPSLDVYNEDGQPYLGLRVRAFKTCGDGVC